MNNAERRRIVQEAKLNGYQGSYVDLFRQAAQNPDSMQKPLFTAVTPEEKEQGLRPLHEAGRTDASMAFPDVPPNTPFNTVGMKAPIDIKKYDKQGHLVKSYENVPPGIQNLDTGPNVGTVLETPSRMQKGGGLDEAVRLIREHNMKDDSTFENIVEMFDPTGISAWDDAYRAYKSMKARGSSTPNFDEGLDMLGAIPVMGKAKAAINLYKRSSKPIRYGLTQAYNKFLRHTGRAASIVDGIEDETGFLDSKEQSKPVQRQSGGPVKEETGPRRPPPPEPKYDDPSTYNYQGWLDSGGISQINSEDGRMHQHSVDPYTGMWLKSKKHKTAWKEHLHSQLSPDPFFKMNMSVVNPEGYFGENQLQYVPRNKKQTGGYNPGKYMNKMEPKVFPNQKRDAKWVNYATQHDFAGRFPGETRTNREIGLERSNRNTVPLPHNPVRPKELKRAQEGAVRQEINKTVSAAPIITPKISFQKGGPKAGGGDPTEDKPVVDAFMMEKFIAEKKGGEPETWRAVADTIGYHESGPWGRMDPKAVQVPSGIGRGIFQFETTHSESFKTAQQRHKNMARAMGVKPDPGILKANSADELSREQQYLLFYGNLYESPAKLADYASGDLPLVDLWLQGHKRKEAKGDRKAFESSRLDAKRNLRNYPSIGIAPNTTASADATRTVSPQLQRAFDILKRDN